jgi:hypothetical protein
MTRIKRSLFASFSSEKEVLAFAYQPKPLLCRNVKAAPGWKRHDVNNP